MSNIYTIQPGNTIRDVCINATGSLANWDAICQANGFDTWTPVLNVGDEVLIPDTVIMDANTYADKQSYPACNTNQANALEVLQVIWDLLADRWILRDGVWDDSGIWIDGDNWKDN